MEAADGVETDAVDTRRTPWRGALIGVGVALGAALLAVLAPQPAHAADDPKGLVGSLIADVTTAVTEVVEPVVAPLPDVRELPVVGGIVGGLADSAPVATVTQPVADLADGLLGGTVASLPVVGGLVGDEPVGSVTRPVSDTVDGALGGLAGTASTPDAGPASPPAASDALWLGSGAVVAATAGFAAEVLISSRVGDHVAAFAVGAEGPLRGPVSAPGDIAPTSAVTAGGPPIGLAAAVLGAGLLFLLARGRVRPAGFRAPPSPVYATDTSPD